MKKTLPKRQVANYYRRAAAWFEQYPNRWLKEEYGDGLGRFCAVGKIIDLQNYELGDGGRLRVTMADDRTERMALCDATGGEWYDNLVDFNDCDSTDVTSLVKGLRAIARSLDHGGVVE